MPLHRFPEEFQRGFSIPALDHKGFQDFAFVIDGPPEVMSDTVDLHEHLVEMPAPVGQGPHSFHPLAANNGPNLFHQTRLVSWLISMPRSCRMSSTLRSECG